MLLIYENGRKKCLNKIRTQDLLYMGTAHSLFNWAMETWKEKLGQSREYSKVLTNCWR